LADALAPNRSAVAMCVTIGHEQRLSGDCTRIVGIAENVRHRYLVDQPAAYVYLPWSQTPADKVPSMFRQDLLVRTTGDPGRHLGAMRSVFHGVAADLPYVEVQSLESLVGERSVRPFRVAAALLAVFGSLALLLATIGLYGTLSHVVAARGREIGVRMALGSSRAMVLRSMLRRALVPVAVGLTLGCFAAAAVARTVGAQLHGLNVSDPVSIGWVIVVLVISAVAGAWLPARRAASIDPVAALRGE
jgi:putative ABC transport system permease protein